MSTLVPDGILFYCATIIRVDDIRGVTLSPRHKIFPRSRQKVYPLRLIRTNDMVRMGFSLGHRVSTSGIKKDDDEKTKRRGLFLRHVRSTVLRTSQ